MAWVQLRRWQWVVAGATVVLLIALAVFSVWPFETEPRSLESYDRPSVWQFLLSDRLTLGFVRAALVVLALFAVLSVPALVLAGRWMRGLGPGGWSADEARRQGSEVIEEYEVTVEELTRERDEAQALARQLLMLEGEDVDEGEEPESGEQARPGPGP